MFETYHRGTFRIIFVAMLVGIVGVSASCGITPSPAAELSSTAIITPSQRMPPTPSVMPATTIAPTRLPTASPSEYPSATIALTPVQATATETLTATDLGEIIYFEVSSGIWKVDPANGENKELLYTDDLCKGWPQLSPDGQWITYYTSECGQARPVGLWLLNIDQKTAWPVSAPVPAWDNDWLPDSQLLYTEYPSFVFDPYGDEPPDFGTDYTTFVYDPATKMRTQVPALPFGMKYAMYAFSPTEEKVAAVKRGEKDLLVMNLDGSQARMLIKDYSMRNFAWSPDGESLAYIQELHRPEIYVIDIDSGRIRQLTHKDEERSITIRNWSPDGKWIAFDQFDQDWPLCVVHVEDGEEKCLDVRPPGTMGYPIAWSPDSSTIANTSKASQGDTWDLYLVRVADGQITRLTHDKNYEYYVLWRR